MAPISQISFNLKAKSEEYEPIELQKVRIFHNLLSRSFLLSVLEKA